VEKEIVAKHRCKGTIFMMFRQSESMGIQYLNSRLASIVFVEDFDEAAGMKRAKEIGIYLNGVSEGLDNPREGDRWSLEKVSQEPELEGADLSKSAIIHFLPATLKVSRAEG